MQRMMQSPQEEWTKYYVNGVECERGAIYQTILDNHFYSGLVNLVKRNHVEVHEEKSEVNEETQSTISTITDGSGDLTANFGLDTKILSEKVNPTNDTYKLFIEKMTHTLDMFYECRKNYSENSKNLHTAVADCIRFLIETISECKSAYDKLMQELSVELPAYTFDNLAFVLSKMTSIIQADAREIPPLALDVSEIKEAWDAKWSDVKKSQYIDNYLSVLSKQIDIMQQLWTIVEFSDDASKKEILDKCNEFKVLINSMINKKASLDAAASVYKNASFTHFKPADAKKNAPVEENQSELKMKMS